MTIYKDNVKEQEKIILYALKISIYWKVNPIVISFNKIKDLENAIKNIKESMNNWDLIEIKDDFNVIYYFNPLLLQYFATYPYNEYID